MVVYQDSRIIETKAVSQTKSACLWCNFEARHCFGARCISEHHSLPISPSPTPIIVRIEAAYFTAPILHRQSTEKPSNLSPATRSQNLSTRSSGARPARFHTPTFQYSPYEHPPSAQLPQLPYPLWTIRQALLHAKSLSRVHLFPILNPPFLYSLLWFISSALMIHGRTLDPVPCK